MSDFSWLKAIGEGRTNGPWRWANWRIPFAAQDNRDPEGLEERDTLEAAEGGEKRITHVRERKTTLIFAIEPGDALVGDKRLIAAAGTLWDKMAAVVEAAHLEMTLRHKFHELDDRPEHEREAAVTLGVLAENRLGKAFDALQAARKEVEG